MKIILLIIIVFSPSNIFSQNSLWENKNLNQPQVQSLLQINGGVLLAGTGVGIFKTTNYGDIWVYSNFNSVCYFLTKHLNGSIYAITGLGFYKSTDSGNSWEYNNSPFPFNPSCLAINSQGHLFLGGRTGIYKSINEGSTWVQVYNYPAWVFSIDINSSDDIFAGTDIFGVLRSTDNGSNWEEINDGISENFISAVKIIPSGDIFAGSVLTTSGKIYKSTNNGNNWSLVKTISSAVDEFVFNEFNQIFAGTYSSGVYRSTNDGVNWNLVNTGLTNYVVLSLLVTTNNRIFAGTGNSNGDVFSGNSIFITDPTSIIFGQVPIDSISIEYLTLKNEGLIPLTISELITSDLAFQIGSYNGTINPMMSQNLLLSFHPQQAQNYNAILSITHTSYGSPNTVQLFGQGIITSVDDDWNSAKIFKLEAAYPNPFNPSTKINYSIPKNQNVSLKVYDVLGNKVATLVDEFENAGNYSVDFNADNLSSGIYFYSLQTENYIGTKKMVLMR